MVYNSGAAQWEYTVSGLSSGVVIPYLFSYQKNGIQYDTPSFSYTHSGTATATPTTAPASSVTVYQNCSYGGTAVSYPVGSYMLAAMQAPGAANDWISSVRVPAG